ncbi:MAG: PTS lactose/cellobiose transporter subunit IIA [Lachnospiraceae bacterium]|nr:PTS lactose/cellobiose transporter subunit IIA [Lachnospiraceae bacterium]
MNEKIVEAAMGIIIHAGDARLFCKEALDAVSDFDFGKAAEKMKKADKEIAEAHRIQTDAIQGEANGEKMEYSVLFTHAQDTLMTIYSEINLANQIIKIAKNCEERIKRLEEYDEKKSERVS